MDNGRRSAPGTASHNLHRLAATLTAASALVVLAACSAPRSPVAMGSMDASTAALGGIAYDKTAPDAQMQAVLDQLAALGGKPAETLSAAEARLQPTPADAVKALLTRQGKSTAPEPMARVINDVIQGPAGPIKTRIYYPMNAGPAPLPVVLYIHGGGWVIADIDVYDSSPRALATATRAIVVSTEYRHAPEAKFPAAHDDT
ncbi:MAG: Alpha/beta hydrolase fold-3 domain protein, partial [Rhizobacter sp.]|nr:Alpha/beta hydrolase fold-3 domain protein [Rhizobacter sp.]